LVGLYEVVCKWVGVFLFGMGQWLGIVVVFFGDLYMFVFDELVNGLDLEGICWICDLFK